jgi:hypothetical protein
MKSKPSTYIAKQSLGDVATGKYDTGGAGRDHAVSAILEAPLGTRVSAREIPPIAILSALDSDLPAVSLVSTSLLEG